MHDPMTVAFEIKSPFKSAPSKFWPKGYRNTLVTIWHVDPERGGDHGNRSDDSCGWFRPPTTPEEREKFQRIGEQEYSTIFQKQRVTAMGESYASICYEPSAYDAIYWAWRRIKREGSRHVWKFGPSRGALTADELEYIYMLASNPVDNLRSTVAEVKDAETCGRFFVTVYRCYTRFNRPWYKHPRWHFWHWSLQVHPWQTFRRWAFSRCAGCGKSFPWGYSPVSHSWDSKPPKLFCSEEGIYHSECSGFGVKLNDAA